MRRLATLGVAGCTLTVMTCWAMEIAVACITDLYPELGDRAAAIDRQWKQVESYEARFAAIAKEVALGRQSLRDAGRALERALRHHPAYVRHLETLQSGNTVQTMLAGQVLSHLKSIGFQQGRPFDTARHAELVREFEEIVADEARLRRLPRS